MAAITGSSNLVAVTFTTDDGNFAGGLSADLSALPLGWTRAGEQLHLCERERRHSCQVSLTYAPTAAASGTLAFGFSYVNSAGTAKTGTVSIPYTAARTLLGPAPWRIARAQAYGCTAIFFALR